MIRSLKPKPVVLSLLLLAASAVFSQETSAASRAACSPARASEVPPALCPEDGGPATVVIARDWKSLLPFSARFKAPDSGPADPVIDLKAASFRTDALTTRSERGERLFLEPDLSGFPAQLVVPPFTGVSKDYFIVQAASPDDQIALRAWLEDEGLPILDYLPQRAYLLRLGAAQLAKVQARPEVTWIGLFQPAYRLDPKLDYVIEASPTHALQMEAHFDPAAVSGEADLVAKISLPGLHILSVTPSPGKWIVRLEGSAFEARELVLVPGCLWVERYVEPVLMNNIGRTSSNVPTGRGSQSGPIMDVEDVWARGIRGEGQIASAADTGLSTGSLSTLHQDFGQQGSGTNPMRVIKGYALGRGVWDDDMSIGGGHGTHTSGSIVGNGFRSGANPGSNNFPSTCFAGTAPKAQFVFQSVMDSGGNLGGIPADLGDLFSPPYGDGARVHSNSWGAAVSGDYNSNSQELDTFAWTHKDMVITFSAGNSGIDGKYYSGSCLSSGDPVDGVIDDDSIGAPGTAKNCITVGASENYRPDFVYEYPQGDCTGDSFNQVAWGWFNGCSYSVSPIYADKMADNANGLAAFSSRGPTNDGRIKPDIVAPGVGIISTRSDKNQTYEQWGTCNVPSQYQAYYMTQGGTSMANPLTAGAAVLVRQYYVDGWHPNHSQTTNTSANPANGFSPSAALVKATLINGAWDMAPGQYGTGSTKEIPPNWDAGHDLPNNAEGYGRVDLEHSLFPGSGWGDVAGRALEVHDVTPGLSTGQNQTYTINVAGNQNPFIATLVWTDPYGAISAGTELVNNLDLQVTSPTGTTYYPNGVNRTSGSADTKNNVEQVKVTSPATGNWTVRVNGTSVPGNGVGGTTTQPFALVVSGIIAPPCSTPPGTPSGLSANSPANGQIALSWSAASPASSYNVYRASGACPASGFTLLASSVAATTYTDSTASAGRTFAYQVTANYQGCESSPSNCASATSQGSCSSPPAFAGLASAAAVSSGSTCAVQLDWSAGTAVCDGPVVYNIYRSTSGSFTPSSGNRIASGVLGVTYTDGASLQNGVPYYYVVRAMDASNLQEETNTVRQNATPGGSGGTQTLYATDFETGSGLLGWETGYFNSGGNANDWRGVMACTAHSGSNIFRWGGAGCTADYALSVNSFAAPGGTAGLTVPAGATQVRLSFWHRWQFEDHWDGAMMRISLDNSTFYYIPASAPGVWLAGGYNSYISYGSGTRDAWSATSSGYPTSFTYTQMDIDAAVNYILSSTGGAAGKTLWIAFGGYSDSSNTNDGWFLDDVAITYQGGSGPCSPCSSLTTGNVNASGCPTITVDVTAKDSSGSPLTGLSGSNFALTEDGSARTVSATSLGSGNYRLSYSTAIPDGQLHALDIALTYGGCTVHTATSAGCLGCAVSCSATVPATASPGTAVSFAATSSSIGCTGTPTFAWSFGDGGTSTSQNPTHTYASSGTYTWALTVTVGGGVCTRTGSITVVNPPVVTSMKKVAPPFTIVVLGSNFQSGMQVFINGTQWTNTLYKTSAKIKLLGGASLKVVVPRGVPTQFRFVNPDGGETTTTWQW
jgi:hypothetical protein